MSRFGARGPVEALDNEDKQAEVYGKVFDLTNMYPLRPATELNEMVETHVFAKTEFSPVAGATEAAVLAAQAASNKVDAPAPAPAPEPVATESAPVEEIPGLTPPTTPEPVVEAPAEVKEEGGGELDDKVKKLLEGI